MSTILFPKKCTNGIVCENGCCMNTPYDQYGPYCVFSLIEEEDKKLSDRVRSIVNRYQVNDWRWSNYEMELYIHIFFDSTDESFRPSLQVHFSGILGTDFQYASAKPIV
jgi:hypothetical protein